MREILFRGKRIDNEEWVEGYLRRTTLFNASEAPPHWRMAFIIEPPFEEPFTCEWAEVDPATVGQYTGLTDKNGKRIFEGDVVDCIARMDRANCVVIFEEGEFRLVPERNYKTYVTGGGYHALRCFEKEVIGNVHDNQELMKEEHT